MKKEYTHKIIQTFLPYINAYLALANNIWPEDKQTIVGTAKTNVPEEIKDLAERHDPDWSTYTIGLIFPTAPQDKPTTKNGLD